MVQETFQRGEGISLLITSLVFVIIGVLIITGLAPTISEAAGTGVNESLENVSGTAATIYQLYDFIWAVGGLVLLVLGVLGVAAGFKVIKKT